MKPTTDPLFEFKVTAKVQSIAINYRADPPLCVSEDDIGSYKWNHRINAEL